MHSVASLIILLPHHTDLDGQNFLQPSHINDIILHPNYVIIHLTRPSPFRWRHYISTKHRNIKLLHTENPKEDQQLINNCSENLYPKLVVYLPTFSVHNGIHT